MPIRVARWIRRRPMLWPYLFMVAAVIAGIWQVNGVAEDNRHDTCLTAIEQNAKLLNVMKPFAASPTNREYFDYIIRQFRFPPKICAGTDIDVDKELDRVQAGLPSFSVTTTTTTPPQPGPQGPPGPSGPRGPIGRTPSTVTTTTTTPRSTTTTTTTPPRPCRRALVLPC